MATAPKTAPAGACFTSLPLSGGALYAEVEGTYVIVPALAVGSAVAHEGA